MAREKLIRETFELDRDIAFHTFRRLHIDIPEVVQACPDPSLREVLLRGFWNQDAEKRYPEFREKVSDMSTEGLLDLKAKLQGQLAAHEFQQIIRDESTAGQDQREPSKALDKTRLM